MQTIPTTLSKQILTSKSEVSSCYSISNLLVNCSSCIFVWA